VLLVALGIPGGCASNQPDSSVLRLATTTSTRDSGLLEQLLPRFEQAHGVRVDVIAVGTGQALELGRNGDVDVLMVHDREAELEFLSAGHATQRADVMYNRFVLLGPADDPAGVRGLAAGPALQSIAAQRSRFVSRGDNSGTHRRELAIWRDSGGRPEWDDYIEAGNSMAATLTVADQKEAYLLVDRGTLLKFADRISLVPLVTRGENLRNPYGVLTVNADKHPRINAPLAGRFLKFLVDPVTQRAIGEYRIDGKPLFHPHHTVD